jgi:hypothetical protein
MESPHERLGPAEVFGQPPRTGRFWFDLLAATSAIFISVISLFVAMRGEETQRGLLAANSWPFVQLGEDRGVDRAKLDIENEGVGPAKIMTFEVSYRGQPADSAYDLLRRCCGLPKAVPGRVPEPITGLSFGAVYSNVLRPGEHIIALELKTPGSSQDLLDRFRDEMSSFTFRTCYCSVLGECWTSNLRDLTQTPVRTCPATTHQFVDGRPPQPTPN